ncbi:glutamate-rich WD repeat containing [Lentinula edodes]|uniref:Glutamate-rich WD repeat-containing protein 1 n=1 Tax=Lentinula edodes TaxID=5353 RepID=A0A1Q3EIN6_LENED|nr:glutamate-rich WD repeat containing [Lentinula edodes]GAW07055.1 glutamate-rich WD repeat containing [Lentinula edodes]
MSKRSVTEVVSTADGQAFLKVSGAGARREASTEDEMGEFEDAWEDEIEEDEDVVDAEADSQEDGMDVDELMPAIEESEQPSATPDVFIPGTHTLGEDEILEPDESVYLMRHSTGVDWPCLSFDILRDNLGEERQRFPHTVWIVTGTQADLAKNNEIVVYKMSSLHKTQKNGDDSDSDDDEEDDALDEDPIIEHRSVPHLGGVNRIRAQPLPASEPLPPPTQPYHVASWAETGKIHIWDMRPLIESLETPGYSFDKLRSSKPVFTIDAHGRAEGFAMDWAASSASSIRLLTGDINSQIFLTTSTVSGFSVLPQPFTSHTSSVEDIQWSPAEPTVFASCSADRTVQIWDVRSKGRKSVAGIDPAHESDVNVISWNKGTSYLLVSGGDEGSIKVWDLRNVQKKGTSTPTPTPIASFDWHKGPITSLEWHPSDLSTFAASSADGIVSLWDLAVEHDDDEMNETLDTKDIPPQMLFNHHQKDVKEIHWHPQIPGAVVSTGAEGFDVFSTIAT